MEAAKKGIVTLELQRIAGEERLAPEELRKRVAKGEVVIPYNKNHRPVRPQGIGRGLRTKINVNLGVSKDCYQAEKELAKADRAVALKADALMDLSSYGRTREFRRQLLARSPVMVGTVPVYDAVASLRKDLTELTPGDFLAVVREHAEDGVDFITVHAGLHREVVTHFKRNPRLTNIVSRGGALLYAWMEGTNKENPFYESFDDLLAICREYDVTLSLGDACRPGSVDDATDAAQVAELIALGELTLRAWEKDVQVMIEGPGHMKIDEIAANVLLEKRLCHGAPFYVLGPVVTDIAPGYDHITAAIGGAIAAAAGADFLCYVTPAEHLKLPDTDEMKEGIMAVRIAAHAADLVKGVPGAAGWDEQMSRARQELNWEQMFNLALDPAKARAMREKALPSAPDTCTMCGEMCAVRNVNRVLAGKTVKISGQK
jgi:phosphomethylpyrimidine synthase